MEKRHRHHVIPRHLGGTDDPCNIELIDPIRHAEIHALRFIEGEDKWFCAMQEGWEHLDPRLQDEVRRIMSERNVMKNPEIAQRMAETRRDRGSYEEQSRRMQSDNPMKRPEIAAKVSAAKKGQPSNRKGAILSDETKEKLRLAATGYKHTEEAKAKMSASRKGKKRGPYKKKNEN
jgi:hypothetical protein